MQRLYTRLYSTKNFYQLFPKTFPKGKPQWTVDLRQLRQEYRKLQAVSHPDAQGSTTNDDSSTLNKAYHTLRQPLTRSQYLLQTQAHIDLSKDQVASEITQQDPELLMTVLDIHEQLESITTEEDLHQISKENKQRMERVQELLDDCYANHDFETAARLTIELKYWVNLDNAIKEWEPGKPVHLTHWFLVWKKKKRGRRGEEKKYVVLVASQTHFLTYFTYNLEQLILVWEFRIHISQILPILLLWQGTVSAISS